MILLAVADPRFLSTCDQGAWWALLGVNYLLLVPRISMEGLTQVGVVLGRYGVRVPSGNRVQLIMCLCWCVGK